jgi:hypothetical protein
MKETLRTVLPIYIVAAMLIVLTEAGWLRLPPPLDRLLTEIGVALLAVGSIHILDHRTLISETAERIEKRSREMFDSALHGATETMIGAVGSAVGKASESIVTGVTTQTGHAFDEASQILQRQVESIKVMEESNLISIYPSRMRAAVAIRAGMAASKEVWLMGISLNEFCRSDHGPFWEAWGELVTAIRAGTKKARILLIDPYCHGAVLRSFSETANTAGVSDRLEEDVRSVARRLHQIRQELGDRSSDLDVRVYGLAPTSFVCRLDTMTFTQSYYFWQKRLSEGPMPVFQYRKRGQGHDGVCIHSEMERHFAFIWKHASIRLDELQEPDDPDSPTGHFLPRPTRGLEWGAHACGMETVFIDRSRPNIRMQEEIRKSNRIWIQGITLKAFFDDGSLSKALEKRLAAADIRILLLDPDGDQAKVGLIVSFY